MVFAPDSRETLVTEEERAALTPEATELLGEPIHKADLDGPLSVTDLLNDHFVRELHRRMYAREQISVALRNAVGDLRYRWEQAHDLTARELGISAK